MNRVINYLTSVFIISLIFSCNESERKTAEIPTEKTIEVLDTQKTKPAELIELSTYDQLSCSKLEMVSLNKTDSIYSHYSYKAPINNEDIDSVFVNRESWIFNAKNRVQVVLYRCGILSKGNYDLAINVDCINDSIRSFIKIDDKKFFIDQFFQKIYGGNYSKFNQFTGVDKVYFLRMDENRYMLIYSPCYYYGSQSWFEHLPVVFEFRNNKLYHIYIMPSDSYTDDPYQFTDFNKDGNLDWISLGDRAEIYTLKDKKIVKQPNYHVDLETMDLGFMIKDTVYNWPCKVKFE